MNSGKRTVHIRLIRLERHRFAVQEVAVVNPDLLHHDPRAPTGRVGDDAGVVARCRVVRVLVGGEISNTRVVIFRLHHDILVLMAAFVILGQVLEDGVPLGGVLSHVILVPAIEIVGSGFAWSEGYVIFLFLGFVSQNNTDIALRRDCDRHIRLSKIKCRAGRRAVDVEGDVIRLNIFPHLFQRQFNVVLDRVGNDGFSPADLTLRLVGHRLLYAAAVALLQVEGVFVRVNFMPVVFLI